MFDPSGLTLGQISSTVRDFSIVGALIVVAWKARGVYESASDFFNRTVKHMDTMETFATTVVNNHLKHIESDLKKMAYRQVRATDDEQIQYDMDDDEPVEE
jgi:hypothetical protein